MPKGVWNISSESRALIDLIALTFGDLAKSKETIQYQIRREMEARLTQQEEALARLVLSAMERPDIPNKEIMGAIKRLNTQRWKEYLERWAYLRPEADPLADSPIERELTWDELMTLRPDGIILQPVWVEETNTFLPNPNVRAFKLRTLRYPHNHIRKDNPGNDTVVYQAHLPLGDGNQREIDANPAWANHPIARLGPDRDVIVKAIQDWIGEEA